MVESLILVAVFQISMKVSIKTSLEEALLKQKTRFLLNAEQLLHHDDPEIIHQLRLSLKTIRSIMGFLGFVSPSHDFNKRHLASLDRTFELSGILRDQQVQLQNLHHLQAGFNKNFKHLEKHLITGVDESKKILRARIDKKGNNYLDKLFNDFFGFLYSRTEQEIAAAYQDHLNETFAKLHSTFIKQPVSLKFLHSLRKQLKDYINILALIHIGDPLQTEEAIAELKHLDQELGKWHDLLNTQKSIRSFLKNHKNLLLRKDEYKHLQVFIMEEINLSRQSIEDLIALQTQANQAS